VTSLLLLAALLAPAQPTSWVERDGTALHATIDLRPWFAAAASGERGLRERLTSGLTVRLRFWLELHNQEDELVAVSWRRIRVRWHLWDERFTTVIEDPHRAATPAFTSIDELVETIGRFDAVELAATVPRDPSVYTVVTIVEVNPVTTEQAARMRRWLANPRSAASLDPLGGGLMGSFVRFFDNLKPGPVEARRVFRSPPFRADRLPHRKHPEPPQ
jgi:hypothetical protein